MPDTILEETKQSVHPIHTHTHKRIIYLVLLWGVKYKDIKKTSQRVMSIYYDLIATMIRNNTNPGLLYHRYYLQVE